MTWMLTACMVMIGVPALLVEAAPKPTARESQATVRSHLIICLDGVGYEVMQEMRAAGHFRYLENISRMIAPFPSITNHSLVAILEPYGAPKAWGYEDLYYDLRQQRTKGGLRTPLTGENLKGTFWQKFHHRPSALGMAFEYMLPPISCWLEGRWAIARLHRQFLKSPAAIHLAYIGGTDSVAHTAGKERLKDLLRELDKVLADIHTRDPNVTVSLFSDHGNEFRHYKHVSFKRGLTSYGFRAGRQLSDSVNLVQPLFGLIGSAVFYTDVRKRHDLAHALAPQEGVDFACWKEGDTVHVVNGSGHAKVIRSDGKFAYRPMTADPLALASVVRKMKAEGVLDRNGFADDRTWFARTQEHVYPDPLYRLWTGFGDYVANPASVLISLKAGYYTGSKLLDQFVRLQATHGNLQRGESLGFAATSGQRLPDYLRAQDLWRLLNGNELLDTDLRP